MNPSRRVWRFCSTCDKILSSAESRKRHRDLGHKLWYCRLIFLESKNLEAVKNEN